jgi:hypothetical protein
MLIGLIIGSLGNKRLGYHFLRVTILGFSSLKVKNCWVSLLTFDFVSFGTYFCYFTCYLLYWRGFSLFRI